MASIESELHELEKPVDLSILRLAKLLPVQDAPQSVKNRDSDVSSDALLNANPASLAEDLKHYKELFAKLRLSYVEQLTKEKFLRAVTDDPARYIDVNENASLELRLCTEKAALNAKKVELQRQIEAVEKHGQELATRYTVMIESQSRGSSLLPQISSLDARRSALRSAVPSPSGAPATNPLMALPLNETKSLLSSRSVELRDAGIGIHDLSSELARIVQERQQLQARSKGLEEQKANVIRDARRAKVDNGPVNLTQGWGRWETAREKALRTCLDVDA